MVLQAPQAYESRSNQMAMASIPIRIRIVIYLEICLTWTQRETQTLRVCLDRCFLVSKTETKKKSNQDF